MTKMTRLRLRKFSKFLHRQSATGILVASTGDFSKWLDRVEYRVAGGHHPGVSHNDKLALSSAEIYLQSHSCVLFWSAPPKVIATAWSQSYGTFDAPETSPRDVPLNFIGRQRRLCWAKPRHYGALIQFYSMGC
jgi:hypothetical protein